MVRHSHRGLDNPPNFPCIAVPWRKMKFTHPGKIFLKAIISLISIQVRYLLGNESAAE